MPDNSSNEEEQYTRDFLPIESHTLNYANKYIKNLEKSIDDLNNKAKYIIQLTGLVSASGITAIGIFKRNNVHLAENQIIWMLVLIIAVSFSLICIIYYSVTKILTPDKIQYGNPIDYMIDNLGPDIKDLSEYIENNIAHSKIYFESMDEYSKELEDIVRKLAIVWGFYTIFFVGFIVLIFLL